MPALLAFSLKTRIEQQPDPIDDNLELRVLLRVISVAILLLSLANAGLGYSLSLLASYTNNYVFGMYAFTVGSVLMAIYASLTIMISSTTKTETAVFKLKVVSCLLLCMHASDNMHACV